MVSFDLFWYYKSENKLRGSYQNDTRNPEFLKLMGDNENNNTIMIKTIIFSIMKYIKHTSVYYYEWKLINKYDEKYTSIQVYFDSFQDIENCRDNWIYQYSCCLQVLLDFLCAIKYYACYYHWIINT